MNPAPVFLVVGAPAVGKSTTSRALATRFARSVHIPVDHLRDMVIAGRAVPNPTWSEALVEQVGLARRTAIGAAVRYAYAAFAVVIDDFWDPPGLLEYRELSDDRLLHRILLRPPRHVALERNVGRHGEDPVRILLDTGIHHVYGLLDVAQEQLDREGWLVLDNSELSPDEAAARIIEAANLRAALDGAR